VEEIIRVDKLLQTGSVREHALVCLYESVCLSLSLWVFDLNVRGLSGLVGLLGWFCSRTCYGLYLAVSLCHIYIYIYVYTLSVD